MIANGHTLVRLLPVFTSECNEKGYEMDTNEDYDQTKEERRANALTE